MSHLSHPFWFAILMTFCEESELWRFSLWKYPHSVFLPLSTLSFPFCQGLSLIPKQNNNKSTVSPPTTYKSLPTNFHPTSTPHSITYSPQFRPPSSLHIVTHEGDNQSQLQRKYIYRCNWKVRTNSGHECHIPKQEKISISTCVRKHLICELQLKEHCVDTTSGSALMYGRGLLAIVC
jgi:hypothetical protein